ncbi:class I adenylate-forming enzyme family protein [Nesterenkonia xinjiangensis]|uniref:Acyl-coenzyme A synthetase/AMP-(Fatty) acid ligase n=1 Tax=Nesterenkonia xinjiangensis TaxID=225327 RepID=A0A7Z0GML6_9MICC|nr:AMP-binding protein [Nesterenkonia xinjiangensis]NYJ78672.1 acyl-coenzyme A synthetase/AMP-(fatty) acid ligase [Nesterenkonia xinjiangensis]
MTTPSADAHGRAAPPPPPRIRPLRGEDHTVVLQAALSARAAGQVPLVGDARWTEGHWDAVVAAVGSADLPAEAAWTAFTSGSTGRPRVVLRSAVSWEVSFPVVDEALDVGAGDSVLIPVHPVSSMALYAAAHADSRGLRWSTPAGARLRAADLVGPTLLHGTPTHLQDLVALLENGARSSLRAVLIGGARVDEGLAARARMLGLQLVSYFGAAELSLVAMDHGNGLRPVPGVDVEVRDHELWVRSEQLALTTIGEGGSLRRDGDWATVGDRASLSEDGVIHLHGRADDAILTGGATVIPADVETWLESLDEVDAALVLGEPHPVLGRLVVACVEPTPGVALDPRALESAARGALTAAQRPRKWRIVTELPRTASGKVRRLTPEQAFALPQAPAPTLAPPPTVSSVVRERP